MRPDHYSTPREWRSVLGAFWLSLSTMLVSGCATLPTALNVPSVQAQPSAKAPHGPTKVVVTRFEVRAYVEPTDSAIQHEAHAVYRRTTVPFASLDELALEPRTSFRPASYSPLPPSAELAAEIAGQKAITSEIRAMQASIAETERHIQAEYGELVRQSAEARKLRQQLEAERNASRWANTSGPSPAPTPGSPEVKW